VRISTTTKESNVIDHLAIQCKDLPRSAEFYDAVLATLGGSRVMDFGDVMGYGIDFPTFWLGGLTSGPAQREVHIAFHAPSRLAVQAFRDEAVKQGAVVLHEPRVWPEYHPGYFGAFVRDPDGNNIEAVHHTFDQP
jgi:catechol 2,3-dioxygenase-like lactoylglutathione lyase family enzyme